MDFNRHASSSPTSIVRLNIGGKKFCTTIDTLTQREPESMLAAMFSGRHTLSQDSYKKGYIFIDRDGKHFRHILNWLRDGVIPTLKDYEYCLELLQEAEYFQLLGLIDGIKEYLNRKEDEELVTKFTRFEVIKCIQSKTVKFRGVNLSGLDLSKLDLSRVDFSFACLRNVLFSNANLQQANFENADLTNANLKGANLERAILKKVDLTNANLESANLSATTLEEVKLTGAVLNGANLQRSSMRHIDLRDVDLTGANLKSALMH